MAESKTTLERVYVIPLKKEWSKVPSYKRARKAVVAIKEFIAKHMKVEDRNLKLVKVDPYFNNDVWFQGPNNAPSRVKVKAIKKEGEVFVTFAETPQFVKFSQAKHGKWHMKVEKKAEQKEEKVDVKTEEAKKDEAEKEKSVAEMNEKIMEQQAKAQKHTTKTKEPKIHRMALKK